MKEASVIAYRNNVVESIHRVAVALVDSTGKLLYFTGDPKFITFLRSSAKPFQAVPVVESGTAEAFGFTQKEIAIIAGSHNGEKKHVRVVQSILKKIGLNKSHLQCGAHVPHYYTACGIIPPRKKFSPLEHNCSGKHAGMLALCVYNGWNLKTYLDPKHPVQKLDLRTISELCEYPERKIGIGIENCTAPTFALPLKNMAIGFAKLRSFRSKMEILSQSLQVVADSMWKYPDMVSGRKRLDYELAIPSRGNILSKGGAEALHCSVILDKGYGLAVKIMDGSARAIAPASIEVYKQLGVLNKRQLKELADFYSPPVYNHRKKKVGFLRAEFRLTRSK
ncbi:MAG TPA: asparaginase [candidate division Zixibacteria bacterium]